MADKQKSGGTDKGGEPPFDRGFWSGRKGHAVGDAQAAVTGSISPETDSLVFGKSPDEDAQPVYPADLRRSGPFARGKVDTYTARHTAVPKAVDDAKTAGVFNSKPQTHYAESVSSAKPILQLDDFEPQTKAWRRTKMEPVAPRVHPNPKPVAATIAQTFRKANAGRSNASLTAKRDGPTFTSTRREESGTAPLDTKSIARSSERPSLVMPIALLIGLFFLVGAGFVYLSKLSQQSGEERLLQALGQRTKSVEIMLSDLDFNPGRIDGQRDAQLSNAILDFQQFAGISEDGEITDELIAELQAVVKMMQPN